MTATTLQSIDTGDTVQHAPSGETWLVAYVAGGMLCACGWPCTLVPVSECTLTEKATAEKRVELLRQLAGSKGDDPRKSHAQRALAAHRPPLPSVHVAVIEQGGSRLIVEARELGPVAAHLCGDDGETYTLSFKTMKRAEFEALGEFNGF